MLQKINSSVKIRVKEPSIKVSVGREGMSDEKLIENIKESMNRHGKNYTAIGKEIGLYRKSVKREIDKNLHKS